MRAVLISIQPKWCELISIGEKTIEVRKSKPKIAPPFKVYIYETNFKNNTYWSYKHKGKLGKVIGEFVCNRISTVGWISNPNKGDWKDGYNAETCLTNRETYEYTRGNKFFEWHISDLVIYETPKELSEFYHHDNSYDNAFGWAFEDREKRIPIKRHPQSWCYVEERGTE